MRWRYRPRKTPSWTETDTMTSMTLDMGTSGVSKWVP
jgi:hypothetical protein